MPRENERISFLSEIVLECSSGRREVRISDLSVSGCYIDSIVNVPVGEAVSFNLNLPTGHSLLLNGEVVYTLPGMGFGIRFTNLSDDCKIVLENIVRSNGGGG